MMGRQHVFSYSLDRNDEKGKYVHNGGATLPHRNKLDEVKVFQEQMVTMHSRQFIPFMYEASAFPRFKSHIFTLEP